MFILVTPMPLLMAWSGGICRETELNPITGLVIAFILLGIAFTGFVNPFICLVKSLKLPLNAITTLVIVFTGLLIAINVPVNVFIKLVIALANPVNSFAALIDTSIEGVNAFTRPRKAFPPYVTLFKAWTVAVYDHRHTLRLTLVPALQPWREEGTVADRPYRVIESRGCK